MNGLLIKMPGGGPGTFQAPVERGGLPKPLPAWWKHRKLPPAPQLETTDQVDPILLLAGAGLLAWFFLRQ